MHGWHGFSLAEWNLREAIASHSQISIAFHAMDFPPEPLQGDAFLDEVAAFSPDYIGFSCHFWSTALFLQAAEGVKHLLPECSVILGGPQVNSTKEAEAVLVDHGCVDYVIRGPGEQPLVQLLNILNEQTSVGNVQGLSFRSEKKIIHNQMEVHAQWDRGTIFHPRNGKLLSALENKCVVSYETVRGCRNHCIYCQYNNHTFQILDLELVTKELTFLCDCSIPHLRICDAHFGGTKERAKKILTILGHANQGTSIKIYPDLSHIDEEYIELLKKANAEVTSIGIQTTNERSLSQIQRPANHTQREEIALLLREFPEIPADLIIGLPGDDITGVRKTFEDIIDFGFVKANIFRLAAFPGTSLTENLSMLLDDFFLCLESNQVLSSNAFPVESQTTLALLIRSFKIAFIFQKTKKALADVENESILDVLDMMDDETIFQIHGILYDTGPSTLLRKMTFILNALEFISQGEDSIREVIIHDLLNHAFRLASERNIEYLMWYDQDTLRRVNQVICILPSKGYISWDLVTRTLFSESSQYTMKITQQEEVLFLESSELFRQEW